MTIDKIVLADSKQYEEERSRAKRQA